MSVEAPKRIQLRRTKGWRKPEGAIVVARPSKWGNPFRIVPGWGDIDNVYEIGDDTHCPSYTSKERRSLLASDAVGFYTLWITSGFVAAIGKGENWTNRSILLPSATVDLDSLGPDGWVQMHRAPEDLRAAIPTLRGHDLACWCPLHQPCHADVLLELANAS